MWEHRKWVAIDRGALKFEQKFCQTLWLITDFVFTKTRKKANKKKKKADRSEQNFQAPKGK